jgi:hypothetical protein
MEVISVAPRAASHPHKGGETAFRRTTAGTASPGGALLSQSDNKKRPSRRETRTIESRKP